MGGPARLLTMLAFVAAALVDTTAAAATERFVPADPRFVVARVRQAVPDAELRELIDRWRAAPGNENSVALGAAFLERAHRWREPMYVGRAEAVLSRAVLQPDASAGARVLYARTLQYRHDFAQAESLLDAVLRIAPYDDTARLQRASVRLVRGEFAGARSDCARLLAHEFRTAALACLAETLAGTGQLARAQALLASWPLPVTDEPTAQAYFLTVRAELHERAGELDRAIADYSAALKLAPDEDPIRAALADALIERQGPHEAGALLDIEKASLALLVRRAGCASSGTRDKLRAQAQAWIDQELARGDAPHLREQALLALQAGDAVAALTAARDNFGLQKQLVDVRVLARAAAATGNAAARRELQDWLRATGYRDVVTEDILAAAVRS